MAKPIKVLLCILLALVLLAGSAVLGWYWYDHNIDRSGWELSAGNYYYKDFHGDYLTGWQTIADHRYYFSPADNTMATYWQEIDGSRYYFSGDGTLDTGFWDIDDGRYYFDQEGKLVTGWLDAYGHRFYMDPQGKMVTSWQEIDDGRYYFEENGTLCVGLRELEGLFYRFQENGRMYTGWDTLAEETVYYLEDGPRATGWQTINDERYLFDDGGVMQTGWVTQGEYDYYLTETGPIAVGPTQIDEQTYYFTPSGIHVVLVNAKHPVPDYYETELVSLTPMYQISADCYDALTAMLEACEAAGHKYTINSAYRTVAKQQEILKERTEYYMEENESLTYEQARAKALESVAYPGTSEHHLGLAVDMMGKGALDWFHEHCWEYGFIVRYYAEKSHITGIIDEPWHFRYVGPEVALELKDSGLCLEEYLGAA